MLKNCVKVVIIKIDLRNDKNVLTKETLCGNVCLSTGKCFSFRKKYKGRCVYGKEKRRN